jgi:hypothetical protein
MSRLFHPGVEGRYDVYQRHTSRRIPVVIIRLDRAVDDPAADDSGAEDSGAPDR